MTTASAMRTLRSCSTRHARVVAAVCALAAAIVAALPAGAAADGHSGSSGAWASVFAAVRPVQQLDTRRVIVRFESPSLAEWSASADGSLDAAQQRAFVRRARREQHEQLDALRRAGITFSVEQRYLRVVNGVSLLVHNDDVEWLRRAKGVASVTQVRSVYPAAAAATEAAGAAGAVAGRDVGGEASSDAAPAAPSPSHRAVVAVLDTGIDFNHPRLRAAQAGPGFDVLAGTVGVEPGRSDEHGTHVAGALVAAADGIGVLPVRVMDAEPVVGGHEAVIGRTDALIAGFERAVDPDGDGTTGDRADVILAALWAPYAGFAGGPEEQAVAGALALGSITVAAAGNDGARDSGAGTIGAPAAAADALAVGAADLRAAAATAEVHARGGLLDTVLADAPVLTYVRSVPEGRLPLVPIDGAAADVVDYLGTDVRSRVAGGIALIERAPRTLISRQVRAAADAGAVAVLVADAATPETAGAIDAPGVDIPAIGITRDDAAVLRSAATRTRVEVSITTRGDAPNGAHGTIAGFSSAGPRYDGTRGPDLLGAGVGVLVPSPGRDADGRERYSVVSGTSVAAAYAAAHVAQLRAQRPTWSARVVRDALIATAVPVGTAGARPGVDLQGGGAVSSAAALDAMIVTRPARADFGIVEPGSRGALAMTFHNVGGEAQVAAPAMRIESARAGGPLPVRTAEGLAIDVPADAQPGTYSGWLLSEGGSLRVPWMVVVASPTAQLPEVAASLSKARFAASAHPRRYPSQLTISLDDDGTSSLRAAAFVRVVLHERSGRRIGLLGTLTDVLPGTYLMGLGGRDHLGAALPPGDYELRLRTVSAAAPGGDAVAGPVVPFTVTK